MDNFTQLFTTLALVDTLHDDSEEGESKIEKLLVPLALCGCMGQPPPSTGAGAGSPSSTQVYVPDNSGQQFMQVLLLSTVLRRKSHSKKYPAE
jgi:hypothetical protein